MLAAPRSFDTVVVVECSQVRTPDELWGSYVSEVAIEGRRCSLLWIKPNDRPWKRFFLDAGLAFWEEWSEDDTSRELAEFADEIEDLKTTVGERLGKVIVAASGALVPTIRIALGTNGEIRLAPKDPNDIESASFLELR